jgi:hypothetical protein
MAPLTPDRVSPSRSGLFASCVRTSGHSASNHLMAPPIALTRYPSASTASGSLRSGLHLKRAGSPNHPAESSSLALRTGHSPPDAPHPASRRRSFGRLQAGERLPEEDFHLPVRTHLQTHPPVPLAPRRPKRGLGHPGPLFLASLRSSFLRLRGRSSPLPGTPKRQPASHFRAGGFPRRMPEGWYTDAGRSGVTPATSHLREWICS